MITSIHDAGQSRLVTAAQVQAVLPSLSEAAAHGLIDEASAMLAAYTSRTLHSQEVTERFRSVCRTVLVPVRWPVTAVASLTVDGIGLDAADYEFDGPFVYRLDGGARSVWRANLIEMRYTGGFDPIPFDLQRACIDLCVSIHAMTGRDTSIRSETIPDVRSVSFRDLDRGGGLMPGHVMDLAAPYRELRV